MPTETPTQTYTPTVTFTPSPTYTPTPQFFIEVQTPAGQPARIERYLSAGDIAQIALLMALLCSVWGMYVYDRIGKRGEK